jgi:hypothetical protein
MKIQSLLLRVFLCLPLVSTSIISCQKEAKEVSKEKSTETESPPAIEGGTASTASCRDELEPDWYPDSVAVQTSLGYQLQGSPYSVAVMQQASVNLYGHNNGIIANKKYVRFHPANEDQVKTLFDADLELFDYPLDREVLEEGDYYIQPGLTANDIPWLYTVVDANYTTAAGITYEVLQDIYVPENDLLLEDEALRLTGNPLEDSCGTIAYRLPVPCEIDPCGPGCPTLPGDNPCGTSGGGGSTSSSPRKPTGQILVWDSNLDENTPVRQARVVARRWFKIETMYTNDQGRFAARKNFRNKVNIFVKFLNNNLQLSRLVGNPVIRSLFPLKRGIGIYSGNLNTISYIFERGNSTDTRRYRHWWAAQFMNAYPEYNEMALTETIGGLSFGGKLRAAITSNSFIAGAGATPMNSHRPWVGSYSSDYIQYYFARPLGALGGELYNGLMNGVLFRNMDMGLGYKTATLWESSQVKGLFYHEMTHAATFAKVGNGWYNDFVLAESFTLADNHFNGPAAPYGDGDDGEASEIISLGESWAEHVAHIFCDRQYAGVFTQVRTPWFIYEPNNPVSGLSSHWNYLEDYSPNLSANLNPFRWIPEGLYYDMFDDRNDVMAIPLRVDVDDQVSNYTDQQFFNALDNDVKSMPQYRNRLLQENGNNQQVQVTNLFAAYGY